MVPVAAGRAPEPDKGPAGASANKGSSRGLSLPPKHSSSLADPRAIHRGEGEVTATQNGREAPLPSSSNPEADPFILKEHKQKTSYSFSENWPLSGPCRVCIGEGLGRDDRPGSLRLSPAPRPSGSCELCLTCNLGACHPALQPAVPSGAPAAPRPPQLIV